MTLKDYDARRQWNTTSDPGSPSDGDEWFRSDYGAPRAATGSAVVDSWGADFTIPFPQSGRWHRATGQLAGASVGTVTPSAGLMLMQPLWPGRKCTIDKIAFDLTQVANSPSGTDVLRMGIYAADATTFLPSGAALIDWGTIDLEAASLNVNVWDVTNFDLVPKLYWYAAVRQTSGTVATTPTFRTQTVTSDAIRYWSESATTPTMGATAAQLVSQTSVTSTLPTIGTINLNASTMPSFMFKMA